MAHSSSMQGLWFLPSVVFGFAQGIVSGSWQMLAFAIMSLAIWPLGNWLRQRRDFPLDGQVRLSRRNVWIGEHRLPRSELLWKKSWHQVVWDGLFGESELDALLESAKFSGFQGSKTGAIWVGVDNRQMVDFDLVRSGPHLIIIGPTGSGKSELLRILVTGWLASAKSVELILVDFKGGATLARFASNSKVIALATDLARTSASAVAETLERQLERRQSLLAETECATIDEYQEAGNWLSRQFIVVDELGELLRQYPRLVSVLEQVAARGRSLGLHLIVANQSLNGISRGLMVNLRARIALGSMDPIDLSQLGFTRREMSSNTVGNWRNAKLKTGTGFEVDFRFPIGF